MRKVLLFYLLLLTLIACSGNDHRVNIQKHGQIGDLYINDSIQDFGTISKSEFLEKTLVFKIENIGSGPVTIQDVRVSCGCLKCKTPQQPLMPTESVSLPIKVNLKNQLGRFNKSVVIFSDALSPKIIRIKGQIIK